ncbi:MAG: hypothetical protein WCJ21_07320 [Planctomycetota bacterium]
MLLGSISARTNPSRRQHHLWLNNGVWWTYYVLHFGYRKRRIRRSLKTRSLEEAILRRDSLFANLQAHGEWVSDDREQRASRSISIQAA